MPSLLSLYAYDTAEPAATAIDKTEERKSFLLGSCGYDLAISPDLERKLTLFLTFWISPQKTSQS